MQNLFAINRMQRMTYCLGFFCSCMIILCSISCSEMEELQEEDIIEPVEIKTETDTSSTENIVALPTEEGVSNVNLESGYRDDQMFLSSGQNLSFKINVPELEEGEKVPLIIGLHWAGDSQTYKQFMDCLVYPAFAQTKAIIFGPSEGASIWWSPTNEARLIEFINLAKKHWPIDSTKVALLGFSNGGTSTWHFATQHPSVISAAIPIAGDYAIVDKVDIPTYIIHGENDQLYSHSISKNLAEKLANNGSDISFVTADGLGHFDACGYVNHLTFAGLWLINEAWQ